jgi:polysaccharide chain length determinant protein (PEP-CTERM system associated)
MIGGRGGRGEAWLLEIWSRRRWLTIVVFATAMVAGLAVALRVPDVYQATATVLVEEPQVEAVTAGNLDRRLQLITQEILSRSRLERLLLSFDLYAQLRERASAETVVQRMRRDIRTEFKAPPVAGGPASTLAFAISYRAGNPETAARVANALASFYLEEDVKIRGRKASEAVQVLKGQLDEMGRKLQDQQKELGIYQGGNLGDLSQQTAVSLAALGRVHADLRSASEERLRALDRRNDLLRRVAETEAGGPAASPEAPTRLARLEAELADLRRRYSDKYPDVIRMKNEVAALEAQATNAKPDAPAPRAVPPGQSPVAARLKESLAEVDGEIAKLKSDEASLRAELAGYTQRLEDAPRRQRAFQEASRDYETTRDIYDSLRKRYEQAQLEEGTEGTAGEPRFRILDEAVVPTNPVAPNRLMLLCLTLIVAAAVSLGAVALAERLDTSFHDVDDLGSFTRVPVLASIPRIVTVKDIRARRARLCVAAVAVLLGLALVAHAAGTLARVEDGLVATLARGRS